MKTLPRIGEAAQLAFTVSESHCIDFSDSIMPKILSTPWLIWFLEHTARSAMLPHLDEDESTVGVLIELRHLAATPILAKVRCHAKVIYVDGKQFSFELKAWDHHELICRGTHKLHVIDKSRMATTLQKKQSKSPPTD